MPKLDTQSITSENLEEYLKSSNDFQFELEIFECCSQAPNASAEHGGTYVDPVTKKDRQFDIRMKIIKDACVLRLAIECKRLKEYFPLLVSRVERKQDESFHDIVVTRPRHISIPETGIPECIPAPTLYRNKDMVGKSTVQAGIYEGKREQSSPEFYSNDAEVYDKWTQALASAFELVSRAVHDHRGMPGSRGATVIIPAVVVPNNTLWVKNYSQGGQSLGGPPTRCDECTLFLGKLYEVPLPYTPFHTATVLKYRISHLEIFTQLGFKNYLNRLTQRSYWDDCIFPQKPVADELLKVPT